jgi:hypothetical protein
VYWAKQADPTLCPASQPAQAANQPTSQPASQPATRAGGRAGAYSLQLSRRKVYRPREHDPAGRNGQTDNYLTIPCIQASCVYRLRAHDPAGQAASQPASLPAEKYICCACERQYLDAGVRRGGGRGHRLRLQQRAAHHPRHSNGACMHVRSPACKRAHALARLCSTVVPGPRVFGL